jgi:SRSO17 transposase
VAQALVHKPPVIILDEPTAGVDVELRQGLWQFIRQLNGDGHTIVLTTHYLDEAEALCSRVGMLKQGTHSVGVQRQYTGSAGKIAKCQIGVSLSVTTKTEHLPVDFELYLPKSWTKDPLRRAEARIPDEVEFRTKPELALDMIRRAVADELPPGVVLADSGFGDSSEFREQIRLLNLDYAIGVL